MVQRVGYAAGCELAIFCLDSWFGEKTRLSKLVTENNLAIPKIHHEFIQWWNLETAEGVVSIASYESNGRFAGFGGRAELDLGDLEKNQISMLWCLADSALPASQNGPWLAWWGTKNTEQAKSKLKHLRFYASMFCRTNRSMGIPKKKKTFEVELRTFSGSIL